MAHAWGGVVPTGQDDGGTAYELGLRLEAIGDLTITGVRVWHPATSSNVPGRLGQIWSAAGAVLAQATMDASLPSGWTEYELDGGPLEVLSGTTFWVSYETLRYYGAVVGAGFPITSGDGVVELQTGAFRETSSALFPGGGTLTGTFYGIDIVYTAGIGGNVAPVITALTVAADGLDVTATAVITDEAPAAVTVQWLWGVGDTSTTGAGVLQASHSYAAAGVYPVVAVAIDTGGLHGHRGAVATVRDDDELFRLDLAIAELGARLETIPGLNVVLYGPRGKAAIVAPAAIVTLPTQPIVYHQTYKSGGGPSAYATVPVVIVHSQVHAPDAYELAARYASAGGVLSIRATIESGVYVHSDAPTVHEGGTLDEMTLGGNAYIVTVLDVDLAK
jgi:hypothetical protein